MSEFSVIILAAGKGTRMNSPLPKLVHPVAGRAMIERVISAVKGAEAREVRVVVGAGEDLVRPMVESLGGICFKQERQLGTADAVRSAKPDDLTGDVMILNGDHPLLEASDIMNFRRLFKESKAGLALVTCELPDPAKFGRIVRSSGKVRAVVEAKDAGPDALKIREVNTGIYVMKAKVLNELLPRIQANNAQNEFYLTDLISLAVETGIGVEGLLADARVALGVNTQAELAAATKLAFARKAQKLMDSGVIVLSPDTCFVEDTVVVEPAAVLGPNVHLRGKSKIGAFAMIDTGSVVTDSVVGSHATVGPYAHLRPGTDIGEDCKVGNFVEMKKVKFGKGAKASHLTYLGDAEVGEDTNIGCGTITCNYAADKKKYVTKIGSGVFVGSDTQFIAPVSIGDGAVIGSGSTITKDVPAGALAVARGKQVVKENYKVKSPAGASVKKDK